MILRYIHSFIHWSTVCNFEHGYLSKLLLWAEAQTEHRVGPAVCPLTKLLRRLCEHHVGCDGAVDDNLRKTRTRETPGEDAISLMSFNSSTYNLPTDKTSSVLTYLPSNDNVYTLHTKNVHWPHTRAHTHSWSIIRRGLGLMMSKCQQHEEEDCNWTRKCIGQFIDQTPSVNFSVRFLVIEQQQKTLNSWDMCIQKFREYQFKFTC